MEIIDLLFEDDNDNNNILGKKVGVEHTVILAKESIFNIIILFLFIYIIIKIGRKI